MDMEKYFTELTTDLKIRGINPGLTSWTMKHQHFLNGNDTHG